MRRVDSEPSRIDEAALVWLRDRHRELWGWVASLSLRDITKITSKSSEPADISVKKAWRGWGLRWGVNTLSFACDVTFDKRTRCSKCPLGANFCSDEGSPYKEFISALDAQDIEKIRQAAETIRDAWKGIDSARGKFNELWQ